MIFFRLIILVLLLLTASCGRKEPVSTAFYYWKTIYQPDNGRQELLAEVGSNTVYLRMFDIVWNDIRSQAMPNAIIKVEKPLTNIRLVPVIFITNQTFTNIDLAQTDSLARKAAFLVEALASKYSFRFTQVQIDCDWTDSTRDKYFNFLKAYHRYDPHNLSATIRLHQVKYRERTGVPPVSRGVLMYYNMGSLRAGQARNSIYNARDAERYLARLGSYPLPLDVALPLYSWTIQSRAGRIIQVYSKITLPDLAQSENFENNGTVYRARRSFFLKGVYIKENDNFKAEETDIKLLNEAADQLSSHIAPLKGRTLIFYELGNLNHPQFDPQALLKIAAHF